MARNLNPKKRERYLRSALKLFAANGLQNTSTAAIAAESGTAAGTLFLYFPTKQDLINELVLEIAQQQSSYIISQLTPTLSAKETFHAIWVGSIQWFQANLDAYRYTRQVRDPGLVPESVVQESESYFGYYYAAIQKGLTEQAIKSYPIELIGTFLYQGIVAVMDLSSSNRDPIQGADYIEDGFNIFWEGIKVEREHQAGE
jgi:AcrR family transcriptional regulator